MSEESRWSLAELQARYQLEPSLADVFVEGTFDQEVLTQSTGAVSRGRAFYPIDVVDVPSELLRKHSLTSGNKQRLIALARELAAMSVGANVACLVDKDLDHWFQPIVSQGNLKWTVFASLEGHFLGTDIIHDVLIVTGGARIHDLNTFGDSLNDALRTLYCMRLADRELGTSLRWPPIRKYLTRKGDALLLDRHKYVTAVLGANSRTAGKAAFNDSLDGWVAKTNCDIRLASRGHDYTEILAWAMHEFGGHKGFATPVAIERLFVLMARSVETLGQELL